jgi:hypothetical protein
VKAACPQCGADVEFRFDDSFVRVCDFCHAAVVRGDRGLETLGKFADLAETRTPLALFATGTWKDAGFQLVGRAQLRHAAGGSWDEWYARFDDGRWGWISEAQGRIYVLFEVPPGDLPSHGGIAAGDQLDVPGAGRMTVAETGEATYVAAAGEIPFRLAPGTTYRYADLSGADGAFATIDYGAPGSADQIALYRGETAALDELHLTGGESAPPAAPTIRARRLACPQCDGSIELRAPDATLRVGCPYCGTLLDVSAGGLAVLGTLGKGDVDTLAIPLGTTGTFEGKQLTVIGWLRRAAHVDGTAYPFEEYLLYEPSLGFRWLVRSDGNWSYVTPVEIGEVQTVGGVRYDGVRFRRYQRAPLTVERVLGEMYWKVAVGEQVMGTDYIAPPAMLSEEEGDGEVTWSLGVYLTSAQVSRAFGVAIPGWSIAPAPNAPPRLRGILPVFGVVAIAALFSACLVSASTSESPGVHVDCDNTHTPPPSSDPTFTAPAGTAVCFSEPFTLDGSKNIAAQISGDVDNSWISVGGDLVNEATGDVESFDRDLEYYRGYEDGESWSEGSTSETVYLDPMPEGRYVLRVELQGQQPTYHARVEIVQGVFHVASWAWLAAIVLGPGLLLCGLYVHREGQRWKDASP